MKFNDAAFMRRLAQKKRELELAETQLQQADQSYDNARHSLQEAQERQAKASAAFSRLQDELWGMEQESDECNK